MKASQRIFQFFYIIIVLTILTTEELAGKELYYEFDIKYISGWPDGVFKSSILSVNGLFPGPTIRGQVGDNLNVLVHNNIQDGQNTSIHWHGIHQVNKAFEDGASHLTQCPLKVGKSQLYSFPLTHSGTYWYHGHEGVQYTEGLWGALIVDTPVQQRLYEDDNEILITLTDWHHRSGKENVAWHLSPLARGAPPYPDSLLLNGRGRYPCEFANLCGFKCDPELQKRPIIRIVPQSRVRLRVVNASGRAAFNFSIDRHTLHTIEVDGVELKNPVAADVVVITSAQRYSFLLTANVGSDHDRFIIRAKGIDLGLFHKNENINPYPDALIHEVTGLLLYDSHNSTSFGAQEQHYTTEPHNYTVVNEPPSNITEPVLLDESLLEAHDGLQAPDYYDTEFILDAIFEVNEDGVRRGSFNGSSYSVPRGGKPILALVIGNESIPERVRPLYIRKGDVIQVVINHHHPSIDAHHPYHLHGHTFWVMGKGAFGDGKYEPGRHDLSWKAVRRDTVSIEGQSWGVIRFVADNPGVWLFHCHIEWHVQTGMALTFIEGAESLRTTNQMKYGSPNSGCTTIPTEAIKICNDHGINL